MTAIPVIQLENTTESSLYSNQEETSEKSSSESLRPLLEDFYVDCVRAQESPNMH